MLRRLLVHIFASVTFLSGAAVAADGDIDALQAAMRVEEIFAVMSAEGDAYGRHVEEDMFPDAGGEPWAAAVKEIYAPARMLPEFERAFEAELTTSEADLSALLAFYKSDLGRRVTTLEISARRALLDESVEDASRLKLEEMRAENDPRLALIEEFVAANDMVEANVSGGLNANYAFYRGLDESGALGEGMAEDEVIAEVWAQEDAVREETDIWIHSYLAMAYAPLSDSEIEDYIAFSKTEPGRDLNRALFAGYDRVFVNVSRLLGQAAGAILSGQEL